ncbi:helix-turn-helix domain-containing protein [Streptomyces sp. NPDC047718]|uniref:tetratricopeptide repeat protein n=1 Tax=Streptomyces sp. NPDC047718 TaxID=3155479 RepID=UPI0034101E3A
MTEQRLGRRRRPLVGGLPPARKRFLLEVRHHVEESGITTRRLAQETGVSTSRISERLSGQGSAFRDEKFVQALIAALGLDDAQRAQLIFLYRQTISEADSARSTMHEPAATELAGCLAELRQKSGLSLREISHRLAVMGSSVAKSTVERTFDDPDRSPLLALQAALALLDALPENERGPSAERVFRAVLNAAAPAGPGRAVVTAAMGSGKTHSVVTERHASQAVPSEETVAALARILDLPVTQLLALRETAGEGRSRIPGRLISEWSPLELEVHPSAHPVESGHDTSTELPPYVHRAHDRLLADSVRDAAAGHSQMVIVAGASSTGKTRACWEAVQSLASRGWRLWHPFNPTRPDALLDGLDRVEPRTVVWLNEAQHYLLSPDLGERVAYALRRLLSQPERGPVLVLGTIWPEYLDRLTAPPVPGAPDLHNQARMLLTGRTIFTPDTFDEEALHSAEAQAQASSDPRLAEAVAQASTSGKLTQVLAGAPQLVSRYQMTTTAARAILQAAMDACRLGVSSPLPQSFLTDAAIDYLSDRAYDMLPEDWVEQAFAELARPVTGHLVPLRRIRPRPTARPPSAPAPVPSPAEPTGATFRLADYLEVYGRRTRRFLCPPASFWHASYSHLTDPEDLDRLADAASDRYRLQWAHHLRRRAAETGEGHALLHLARLREESGYRQEAEHLARAAADAGQTSALRELARMRHEAGDHESAQALAQQAADHGDALALAELAWTREDAGDHTGAEVLAQQVADVGETFALLELARMRETTGDRTSAEALYRKAADAGDSRSLLRLAEMRQEAGDVDEAEHLVRTVSETDEHFESFLSARALEESGDLPGAEALYRQAVDAGSVFALAALARIRERVGDQAGAEALCREAADAGAAWLVAPAKRWLHGLDPDGAPTPPWN